MNSLRPNVTEDTTCSAGPIFFDRDSFITFLKLTLGGATTHHQGYDPHIKVTSATTAEALWTLEDVLIFGGVLGVHGYGHYNDRYTKVDGKWVVKYSKLTRTRLDLINPDGTVIQANAPIDQVVAKVKAITGGLAKLARARRLNSVPRQDDPRAFYAVRAGGGAGRSGAVSGHPGGGRISLGRKLPSFLPTSLAMSSFNKAFIRSMRSLFFSGSSARLLDSSGSFVRSKS